MGKIDALSNEIKKYTKSYSGILVGMHNDMTKYKNEVKSQEINTILQLLLEFFQDAFKGQFEQKDADAMIELLGSIIQESIEIRGIIDNYLKKLLPN